MCVEAQEMATKTLTLNVSLPMDECYDLLQKIGVGINGWKNAEADKTHHRLKWKWGSHWGMRAPASAAVSMQSMGENETTLVFTAKDSKIGDPLGILESELHQLADPFTVQAAALAETRVPAVRVRPATPEVPERTGQTTKKCPFCAEEIQEAAVVCKHCGRDLSAPLASELPARKAALQAEVERYQSVGYRLSGASDISAALECRAPWSWLVVILLVLLAWPLAIIYYATRKKYHVQLAVDAQAKVGEVGGTLAEYQRDVAKGSRRARLWVGCILIIIGILGLLFGVAGLAAPGNDPAVGLVVIGILGVLPLVIGILDLRSRRKIRVEPA
jgi:hypothetical protein